MWDEFKDLVKVEKGRQAPKPTIRDYQYTDRTTEEHGIAYHLRANQNEVPIEAPIKLGGSWIDDYTSPWMKKTNY